MSFPRCPHCGSFLHHTLYDNMGRSIYACTRCQSGHQGHDRRYFRLNPLTEVKIVSESRGVYASHPIVPEDKAAVA